MKLLILSALLFCLSLWSGCANSQRLNQSMSELGTGPGPDVTVGYLAAHPEALPDSALLLEAPPHPDEKSAAFAADLAVSQESFKARGTRRWDLAVNDAELSFPAAAESFSCAVGVPINEKHTPHVYTLLRRSLADASRSVERGKKKYLRLRPFLVNHQPVCTPDLLPFLRTSGSYPSGHSAIGWAWALILSEVAPDRIDAVLARGLAFGQSRVICNVHWQSDVVAGRVMGAGAVAALHSNDDFLADVEGAKAEVAEARYKGLRPEPDCAAETEALGR